MSKKLKPFTIIHNLEGLSEAERQTYLGKVSEFMGLPPEMNALDMLWIPDEATGLRRYVPYARKGTTDILREIHGIQIKSMEQHDGPGYVSFKATGTNAEGRQEVAVGAHSTEGLKGERLAAAVMTAETRAGRRLTLKFVGAGILDESETNAVVSNISVSGASLAQLAGSPMVVPPPLGAPASVPGKDITGEDKAKLDFKEYGRTATIVVEGPSIDPEIIAALPTKESVAASFAKDMAKQAAAPEPSAPTTPAATPASPVPEGAKETAKKRGAPRGPRKKKGEVTFAAQSPQVAPTGIVQQEPAACPDCGVYLKDHNYVHGKGYVCLPKVSEPPATVSREGEAVGTEKSIIPPPAEKKSINLTYSPLPASTPQILPESVKVEYHVPLPHHVGQNVVVIPDSTIPPEANITVSAAGAIDKTQFDAFRARLREYANVILPRQGGMLPSEGIGGAPNKLRAFALKFTGASTVEVMTVVQWENLFDFLDSYNKEQGPKALVAYINESIGAK